MINMEPFNDSNFRFHANQAKDALNKMYSKINRPEVPLEKRNENLKHYYPLLNFLKNSERTVSFLLNQIDETGNDKFLKGFKAGKSEEMKSASGGQPNKLFDKEAYRCWWELQVKNKWPEHF